MAYVGGTPTVPENGPATTGDVTTVAGEEIHRIEYTARNGTAGVVFIGSTPVTVATRYGSLTANPDGTYSYTPDESLVEVNGLDSGQTLSDSVTFIQNSDDTGSSAVVDFTVTGVNDAPVADADGPYATNEGTALVVNAASGVLAGDTDADNADGSVSDTLTAVVTDNVDHGVLVMNPDGSFTYTPATNYFGADQFTYVANDGSANSNPVTVVINVAAGPTLEDPYDAVDDGTDPNAPGNDPTVPGEDFNPFITLAEDTVVTYTIGTVGGPAAGGNFLSNDQNPDNEPITVQSISNLFDAVTNLLVGTVTYNFASQTYTIDPNDNYNGYAYFDYVAGTANDPANFADDQVDQARVYVRVTSVNDAPVLNDGTDADALAGDGNATGSGSEDAPITVATPGASDLHGGAPSENNVPLTYSLVSGTQVLNGGNGTFSIDPNTGAVTYTPGATGADQTLDTGESRTVSVQYRATDTLGGQSTPGTVTIVVNGANDAPVAGDDFYPGNGPVGDPSPGATEDTPFVVDAAHGLLINDTDVDIEPLSVVAAEFDTANGHVVINSDGSFVYTPDPDFNGTDSFNYTVTDGTATDVGHVEISVGNTADDPVAVDDNFTMREDPNQPPLGAINNANGWFSEADLVGNDTDPDSPIGSLRLTGVGAALNGTVELVTIGGTRYAHFIPDANYSGPAQFDYAVTDETGNSDVGTVNLTVQERADGAPVATDDTLTATEQTTFTVTAAQLLANDTDPDNAGAGAGTDALHIRAIQNLVNLRLSAGADNTYGTADDGNIQRDGDGNITSFELETTSDQAGLNARFDYVVDDSAARENVEGDTGSVGGLPAGPGEPRDPGAPDTRTGTDIGTVNVTVTNVNDAPDAQNDTLTGTTEDSTTGVTFTAAQLLANDHDADNAGNTNAGLTATIPTGAVNGGTITNNGNGTYTFKPNPNFNGTASFTYTVTDSAGATDTATVSIPVASVNDAPVAVDDTLTRTVTLGAPLIIEDRDSVFSWDQVLGNDTDVDGDTLVLTGFSSPYGTVIASDPVARTFTFRPTPGYDGPAYIDYTVADGNGGTDVGRASFTVIDTVVGAGTGETLGGQAVFGNGGNDVLNGTPNTDELYGGDGNDTMNGFGSADFLRGGIGNDTANGGDGNDTIYADDGGTDTANGDAGNDGIFFGATFEATDVANGGADNDTLALRGNYGTGIGGNSHFFSATNMQSIETLLLVSGTNTTTFPAPGGTSAPPAGGFDYYFTSQDANVAAGQILTIISGSPGAGVNGLQAGEDLYFDGSDEKDGSFRFFLGNGNDRLIGGQLNDGFFFATGAFTGADQVDGRGGTDTLALRGDYGGGVTLTNVVNVETVSLLSAHRNDFGGNVQSTGFNYNVTLSQQNVAAGGTLTVTGNNLGSDETMTVNGNAILGGNLVMFGGAGNDSLSGGLQTFHVLGVDVGGGGTDLLIGGLGGDRMDGGRAGNGGNGNDDGANVYLYRAANESNGSQTGIDHIQGFNYQVDKIDINAGGPATNGFTGGIAGLNVTDVNAVFNGTFTNTNATPGLQDSEFFTQLGTQLDNALNPGQAAFLQVTSGIGGYSGSTIFVADTNGNGSVDSSDLIIVFDNLQGQLPPSTEFLI